MINWTQNISFNDQVRAGNCVQTGWTDRNMSVCCIITVWTQKHTGSGWLGEENCVQMAMSKKRVRVYSILTAWTQIIPDFHISKHLNCVY